jgi:hypothetical protein
MSMWTDIVSTFDVRMSAQLDIGHVHVDIAAASYVMATPRTPVEEDRYGAPQSVLMFACGTARQRSGHDRGHVTRHDKAVGQDSVTSRAAGVLSVAA